MKKRTLRILLISWLIFSFIYIGAGIKNHLCADELSENAQLLGAVLGLIHKYYVDEIKLRDIVYPAIKEMVNQLDPHSFFLTPEEAKKEKEEEKETREYAGVGMIFGARENLKSVKEAAEAENGFDINNLTFEIKKIFDNSPAAKAGLLPKDEIVMIDGVPTKDIGAAEIAKIKKIEKKIAEKFEQIRKKIIGPEGALVTLTMKRADWTEPKDFIIIRTKIQIKNVEWKIIEKDRKKVGYLKIMSFTPDTTAKEVKKAVVEFKNQKVQGAVIDLRNNPGGHLDYCIEVLESFLPPDTLIISAKGKAVDKFYYTSKNYSDYFSLPLVVLINEGSASASEIMAGVLRYHKRAVLVGEKTYGKGSVQAVWSFTDGSQLRLTISKYFLPGGENICGKGISPNIEVETEFDEPIMNEALKVLKDWKTYQKNF